MQAGLLWGLSALGGYPGMVILTFFFLMFWALGRRAVATAGGLL